MAIVLCALALRQVCALAGDMGGPTMTKRNSAYVDRGMQRMINRRSSRHGSLLFELHRRPATRFALRSIFTVD